MAVLRSRLLAQEVERQQAEISQDRKSQVGTGDRSGRVRTYNFPQDRVTDHRVGYTRHNLEAVLDGEIDDILHRLVEAEQAPEPGELRRMRLREAWVRSRRRLERADIPDADIEAQVLLRNTLGIDRATFPRLPGPRTERQGRGSIRAHGWAADRWGASFLHHGTQGVLRTRFRCYAGCAGTATGDGVTSRGSVGVCAEPWRGRERAYYCGHRHRERGGLRSR